MSRGRRYEKEGKLNIKKVIAVAIAFAVIIMFIVGIKTLLSTDATEKISKSTSFYNLYDNGKWGVIDENGKIVIEAKNDEVITIPNYKKDIFILTENVDYDNSTYKTRVINSKNEELFTEYDEVNVIENSDSNNNLWYEQDVLKVKKDNLWGLINLSGEEILPIEYEDIYALEGVRNSLIIKKNNKVGLSDNKGSVIIEPEYKEIRGIESDYKNGYIVISQAGNYGKIDFDKSIILGAEYKDVKPLTSKTVFVVKENKKYNLINSNKEVLLSQNVDDAQQISGENVVVKINNKFGVINTSGNEIIKPEYQYLEYTSLDQIIIKKDNKFGIMKQSGEIIIPLEYDKITYNKNANLIICEKKNNEEGIIYSSSLANSVEGIITGINYEQQLIKVEKNGEVHYYNFSLDEKTSECNKKGSYHLAEDMNIFYYSK